MRKLTAVAGILLLGLVMVMFADELTRLGNTEPDRGPFRTLYLDSAIVKSGVTRTINVPNNRVGYNLQMYTTDPYTREESLQLRIFVNNIQGVDNPKDSVEKYLPLLKRWGIDNELDSFYIYGPFSSFTLDCTTGTVGADAQDSLFCVWYMFYGR